MSSRRVFLVAACGVLAACAAPPAAPAAPPSVAWARRHHAGSAVSGPTDPGSVAETAPDDALHVRVRWVGLPEIPALLEPIGRRRRLLLDLDGADVLRAVPVLSAGARAAPLTDADQELATLLAVPGAWSLGEQRAALPPGITAELSAADATGGRARVGLRVHRTAASTLDVAVVLERGAEGELVVLAPVDGDRLVLGLVVPTPIQGLLALGAVVEVAPPPGPGEPGRVAHRAAHAACMADLARDAALARAAALRDPGPAPADDGVGLSRALEALREPSHRRGALFALGQRTGARLVEDVALGGDDALVDAVASAALDAIARPDAPRRGAALGWVLERAAVSAVAAAAEDDPPSAVAAGLLVRAAGVVGAFPQSLRELAAGAADLVAWRARLVDTNTAALDDPSPLQRIVAEEWLAARREPDAPEAVR